MTPPATSAGEARPDGLGAMLGHVGAPQDLSVVKASAKKGASCPLQNLSVV